MQSLGLFALTTDAAVVETPALTETTPADADLSTNGTSVPTETPAPEAPRAEGQQTPVAETQEPAPELSLSDLDAKAKREGLTPAEYTRQQQLQRAENDRQQNEQRYRTQLAQQEQQRRQQLQGLVQQRDQNILQAVRGEIESASQEGRPPSLNLIETLVKGHLQQHDAQAAQVHQLPIVSGLFDMALGLIGDTAANRTALARMTPTELVTDLVQRGYEAGKLEGPGAGHVVMTKAAYDKALADARKAGGDAIKAEHGLGGASSTAGGNGTMPAGARNFSWLMGLSPDEYDRVPVDERRRITSEEARRRGG